MLQIMYVGTISTLWSITYILLEGLGMCEDQSNSTSQKSVHRKNKKNEKHCKIRGKICIYYSLPKLRIKNLRFLVNNI